MMMMMTRTATTISTNTAAHVCSLHVIDAYVENEVESDVNIAKKAMEIVFVSFAI